MIQVMTEDLQMVKDYREIVELPDGAEVVLAVQNEAGILLEVDYNLENKPFLTGNTIDVENGKLVFNIA